MADPVLRSVTVEDLAGILEELEDFWGSERDMGFLHQALYVHEFGETSVLAERSGRALGYLLGFVGQDGTGYIHAVAVRREARGGGLARSMYERFEELVAGRDAHRLKAVAAPENRGSIAFHTAMGFSARELEGYSPSGAARVVFLKPLGEPPAGAVAALELGDGVRLRRMRLDDAPELHRVIERNRAHIGRWLPFADQPFARTEAHVRRSVLELDAGRAASMLVLDGERLAGAISFVDPSRQQALTQLGYWLTEEAQGRGIMTRAVTAMTEQAFGPWGFERVEIRVAAGNERSRAIPERLGFRLEGRLRAGHRLGGVVHEELIYGMLREDREAPAG